MKLLHRPTRLLIQGARPVVAVLGLTLGLTLLGVGVSPGARADQIGQKQGQRGTLTLTIQQIQQQIGSAQDQQRALQTLIDGLNTQIGQSDADVAAARAKLAGITAALGDAEDQLQAVTARLNTNRALLSREMVVSYELGSEANALTAVFGSGDFNQGWERLIAIRRISAAEDVLTNDVEAERRQITATVAVIAEQKRRQVATLGQLQADVQSLQGQLGSRQNAQALLVHIEAADTVRLQQAEQSARELDAQIAQLQAEAAAARARGAPGGGTGQFAWPETGPITQNFGCTPYPFEPYDANCPSHHLHTGIDIGAPGGTPVGASDGGVAHLYYSSYGYGNHVIIDHGNGFMSVYGHLATFAVGEGQSVGTGQIIGHEGSTGNSTGPHLHFEIRSNDVPVNPFTYLP